MRFTAWLSLPRASGLRLSWALAGGLVLLCPVSAVPGQGGGGDADVRGATGAQRTVSHCSRSRPEVSPRALCLLPDLLLVAALATGLSVLWRCSQSLCSLEAPGPLVTGADLGVSSLRSEYGFAEKVVEGMFIVVNSITIKIHSKAFHASFELWQLQGYSVNPSWQQSDLRLTRITDPQRGEVRAALGLS